jgi:hypothetical protein
MKTMLGQNQSTRAPNGGLNSRSAGFHPQSGHTPSVYFGVNVQLSFGQVRVAVLPAGDLLKRRAR